MGTGNKIDFGSGTLYFGEPLEKFGDVSDGCMTVEDELGAADDDIYIPKLNHEEVTFTVTIPFWTLVKLVGFRYALRLKIRTIFRR